MFKRRTLEKYLYDMPFLSCTDPQDASEMRSRNIFGFEASLLMGCGAASMGA
jgi:hypothetical protein